MTDIVNSSKTSTRRSAALLRAAAAVAVSTFALSASAADRFLGDGVSPANQGSGYLNITDSTWAPSAGSTAYGTFAAGDVVRMSAPGVLLVNGATDVGGLTATGTTYIRRVGATLPAFSFSGTLNVPAGSTVYTRNAANFTNGLTITGGGTYAFGGAGTGSATLGVTVTGNSTLLFNNDAAGIADTQPLTVDAGSTVVHGLVNDTYGPLNGAGTITGGFIGLGVTTGAQIRPQVPAATTATFSGSIQGAGVRFRKLGAGTQVLSGVNTFDSYTDINLGTLRVEGGQALADTAPVYFLSPGTATQMELQLGANETFGGIANGNTQGGILNIGAFTATFNQNRPYMLFGGNITGTGTIVKNGTGAWVNASAGSPVSTFAGKYVINQGIAAFPTDVRIGAVPAAPVSDYFTLNGGILGNTTVGGYLMNANRGITVTGNSGIRVGQSTASNLQIAGQLTGASGVTLTKSGAGILTILNTANGSTYSGNWLVDTGTLQTTALSGAPLGVGTATVEGNLGFAPASAAGVVNLASPSIVVNDGAIVSLNRGTGSDLVVTAPSFSKGARGTMVLQANSGTANLGTLNTTSENLIVTGGVANVNGIVPGTFGAVGAAGSTGTHLTYDSTFGFKAATYTTTNINASTASDIVDVPGGGANMTANTSAFAVRIGNGTLDLNGNTLTAGDGSNQATILMNPGASITNGTVDFGASQGVIYGANTTGVITATLAGSNGVTFTGINQASPDAIKLGQSATYTGPTVISGGSVRLTVNNALPTGTALTLKNGPLSATTTVGTLNLADGISQTVASIDGDRTAFINIGAGSTLNIAGNGASIIETIVNGGAGSTLSVTGGGSLILGSLNQNGANNNVGDALQAQPASTTPVSRLLITNGSTLSLSSQTVLPPATTLARGDVNPSVPNNFEIDGGTLVFNSVNSGAFGNGGASTFTVGASTGTGSTQTASAVVRGLQVGANGATIVVSEPDEIVLFQRGNNSRGDLNDNPAQNVTIDSASLIKGSGNITLTGPGFFRIGPGNVDFTGKWIINGGILQFNTDDAVGVTSATNASNALGATPGSYVADAITLNGGGLQSAVNGIINANRGITIGANGGIFNGATGGFRINSPISGSGDIRVVNLTPITLNGASPNFSGDFNIEGGGLILGVDGAAGTGNINFVGNQGAQLTKASTATVTISNNINFGGNGTIEVGLGTSGDFTLAGNITGSTPITVFASSASATSSLVLSGDNSGYNGHIIALAGAAIVPVSPTALGSAAGHTVIDAGAFLLGVGGTDSSSEPVYLGGEIANVFGNNTFGDVVVIGGASVATPVTLRSLADNGTLSSLNGVKNVDVIGAGTITIAGTGVVDGNLNINVGNLIVDGSQSFDKVTSVAGSSLVVNGTLTLAGDGSNADTNVLNETALTLGASGILDTTINDLIVNYTGTSPLADLQTLQLNAQLVASPDFGGISTLMVLFEAADFGLTEFNGIAVDGDTVIGKYTYTGDANLDGQVDAFDYSIVDDNFGQSGTFTTGDLNGDGIIDAFDYSSIDDTFGAGVGNPLRPAANSEVFIPEPSSLGFLALAGGLLARRRRA